MSPEFKVKDLESATYQFATEAAYFGVDVKAGGREGGGGRVAAAGLGGLRAGVGGAQGRAAWLGVLPPTPHPTQPPHSPPHPPTSPALRPPSAGPDIQQGEEAVLERVRRGGRHVPGRAGQGDDGARRRGDALLWGVGAVLQSQRPLDAV